MILQLLYIVLALLGLSFLVFIHELGHYIIAIRNGIKVEVFSIGFGKPILKWKRGDVQWQICYVLFGGYVKMLGQEKQGNLELHQIQGGFYHASPFARIKVAFAGPFVNIVFALVAFTALWLLGGREQPFSQHTKIIGWVEAHSDLYAKGVRPGDLIESINGHPYNGFKDLMYAAATSQENVHIEGKDVNYFSHEKTPFEYSLLSYPDPNMGEQGLKSFGIVAPARYLIYDDFKTPGDNPIAPNSAMANSGIQKGDRIIWVNGELIFSMPQLSKVLNDQNAMVTVIRDSKRVTLRIPTFAIGDLRLKKSDYQEFDDWKHAAHLTAPLRDLLFIPYDINYKGVVLAPFKFVDQRSSESILTGDAVLRKGDQIVAIDGEPVRTSFDILDRLQHKIAHIIVEREAGFKPFNAQREDDQFIDSFNAKELSSLVDSIGSGGGMAQVGSLVLLKKVEPLTQKEFLLSSEHKSYFEEQMAKIHALKDVRKKAELLKAVEAQKSQRILGIALKDRAVIYNPNPFILFTDVIKDTYRTFSSLLTGKLSPKWLSGPIGFVQVMQHGWSLGFKEALYWMGMISLGLAIFNLLPIPALDGGHISFSLYEMVTKKPISSKVMERMVIPFVICLIGLFIFVTFQDIRRLFNMFF
jgi:regulator of sigma E protease